VLGTILATKEAAKHFGDNGGSVINVGSVVSKAAVPGASVYSATKGAVDTLTLALAAELGPRKIRVNVIAPALVRTPMSARAQNDPKILELMKPKQPLAEDLIDAQDVARASCFLLGDDSRRITADALTVDAGWSVSG